MITFWIFCWTIGTMNNDREAFIRYSGANYIYNKAQVAEHFGVRWGTQSIPDDGKYCIKPLMNLDGCSKDAIIVENVKGMELQPGFGYFEYLKGRHWTFDVINDGYLFDVNREVAIPNIVSVFEGTPHPLDFKKFLKWERILNPQREEIEFLHSDQFALMIENINIMVDFDIRPDLVINFEMIGNKPIEIHLRRNTDPVDWDVFYPVWKDIPVPAEAKSLKYIPDTENHPDRIGFYVRNYA